MRVNTHINDMGLVIREARGPARGRTREKPKTKEKLKPVPEDFVVYLWRELSRQWY
jgi:hypothetical protein